MVTFNLDPSFSFLTMVSLVTCRCLGMLLSAPGFSEPFVNKRFQLLFTLGVSVCLSLSFSKERFSFHNTPASFFLQEFCVGVFLGLLVRVTLEAFTLVGHWLGATLSFSALSPKLAHDEHNIFSALMRFFFLVLIFVCDLHHVLFINLKQSYVTFPIGGDLFLGDMTHKLFALLGEGFTMALRLCVPFIVVSLLYYFILGLLNRLVPFIPVFFVGRPLEIILTLAMLIVCLLGFAYTFDSFFLEHVGGGG
jgi:flagellar biosynthetic protein FliR